MTALSTPAVSVVVGVRDGGAALRPAIESLLAQEGPALEVIVVDDGSIDETPEVLAALALHDPRLRLIWQDRHGLTAALRRGCAAAQAPLIARQDADERSAPTRLARQVAAFERYPDLSLVSCWTQHVAPCGEPLRVERGRALADSPVKMFERTATGARVTAGPSQHGSTMFPAALYARVGGYRQEFALAQDWDLWLRLGEVGRFLMVGEVLLSTTMSPASLSFRERTLQHHYGDAANEALRLRQLAGDDSAAVQRAAALSSRLATPPSTRPQSEALALYHIGELLRRQGSPRALHYLRAAVVRDRRLARAWVRIAQALVTRHFQRRAQDAS